MTPLTSSLQGLGVALITPFNAQGQIDFPALQNIVGRQIEGGTSFLVVLGTTGETPESKASEREVHKGPMAHRRLDPCWIAFLEKEFHQWAEQRMG